MTVAEPDTPKPEPKPDTVRVRVVSAHPLMVAGKVHDTGATFTAPKTAVREAVARGLLEVAEPGRKR